MNDKLKEAFDAWTDFTVGDPTGLHLVWEYIGEGNEGDYNEDDPEDTPRLRASLYRGEDAMDDASYCTLATPATPKAELEASAKALLSSVDVMESYREGWRLKNGRVMEGWTWENYSA